MTDKPLTIADYPLAENRPDLVRSARGKALEELTVEAVMNGDVTLEDLRITPDALEQQGEISRAAGRDKLADNFDRASEMARVPQPVIMEIYEILRPGRAADKTVLLAAALRLRQDYEAEGLAKFVEEAALIYEKRGLFSTRY